MPTALITGIAGQDGSYLCELLLEKGYRIHGVVKSTAPRDLTRLKPILKRLHLHKVDLTDYKALKALISKVKPNEVYNLASPSFVPNSWLDPQGTTNLSALGVLKLLEAIRTTNRKIRFFQASSSEIFGNASVSPQNENTAFNPTNPYAASKLFGHMVTGLYRKKYGMFAVSGIMFNHESPRRAPLFVTRKITQAVARIKAGKLKRITLGNLDARRDWGFAKDYARAMWRMLRHTKADDYVIATGQSHSVRELAKTAFACAGLDYKKYVTVDRGLWRPAEKFPLLGDASKARNELGWRPQTSFVDLIQLMTEADMKEEGVL